MDAITETQPRTEEEWQERGRQLAAWAREHLQADHDPDDRCILVGNMTDGAWMMFEYDRDGHLSISDMAINVRKNQTVTGKRVPSHHETQWAWEMAYRLAPRGAMHVTKTVPYGCTLHVGEIWDSPHTSGVVTRHTACHVEITLPDGDVRSLDRDHAIHLATHTRSCGCDECDEAD